MTAFTKRISILAPATAAILALAACSAGAGAGSSANSGGTHSPSVKIGLTGEPANFDLTAIAGSAIPQVLMNNVYEGLVTLDQDGTVQPRLAESWTVSDDRTTYDFKLREGVTFSNGEAFTAEDVKFSLERVATNWKINQAKMSLLDHVEVVSPTEAKVVLKTPSNAWLFDMTGTVGLMFDPSGIAKLATEPIGTGPFTITERVQGDHIGLAARAGYWGEEPEVTDVRFRYFADAVASTNALRSGDVDMLFNMQAPDLISQFESDSKFEVIQGSSNGEILLSLNNKTAPFKDVRVRQAIAYALDPQAIMDTAWAGNGARIGAMVPPTDPYYEDLTGMYKQDLQKAKDLLKEAGAENLSITFDVPTRPYAKAVSEVVVSQLAEIGVKATINTNEFPAVWLDKVFTKHDYQMSVILAVEPRDILATFNNPNYYIGYDNTEIAPIAAAADQGTSEEWVQGMKEVTKKTAEDVASIPLFLFPNVVVADSELKGIAANAVTESLELQGLNWAS
ncbi:ABC transporter substrate-binding protein [Arthrobacter sp. ISL-69]|uniref:ABC transporter substrate-binding protein n=1 Tax=Arthrobacter sp. ISL-69 TaxID=2819113 RepID=UPI001BE8648A|nr:ABC transporter substrate-binding protein [Arthrobacter sp. ISL-69]MBT2534831.1 ABC transporter substrate-binding protein [Arthrobacter sp. ISL-69]